MRRRDFFKVVAGALATALATALVPSPTQPKSQKSKPVTIRTRKPIGTVSQIKQTSEGIHPTFDTGYFYAPYIPLITTPIFIDPDSFSPRKGILTRYGRKMLRDGEKYYGRVKINAT